MIFSRKILSISIRWTILYLILFSLIFGYDEGDLVITEYFAKSNGAIPDYVELYNTTDSDIDLQGWTVSIVGDWLISESFIVPSHGYVFFTGEFGYFTDSNNILYVATNDLRFEEESIYYDEDLVDDSEDVTIEIISNGYWLPYSNLNHVAAVIVIRDPSDIEIDRMEYSDGSGCPDFSPGSINRGHSAELILDPNNVSIEDSNDDCSNWEISNQTPSIMLNENSIVDGFGGDGTQEWGSPGFSNYTPINVVVIEGGEATFTIGWESDHGVTDIGITNFKVYRDSTNLAQLDYSTLSYQDEVLDEGILYNYQISAINSDESGYSVPLYVSLPDANAGDDQIVNIESGNTSYNVTLTGSFFDPEGDATTYEWTLGESIIGTDIQISQSMEAGIYNVTFKVTDSHGGFSTDDVEITVNSPLTAIITEPMVYQNAPHNGSPGGQGLVTLDGTQSVAAAGFEISSYKWSELIDGEEVVLTYGYFEEDYPLEVGTHTLILEVIDNQLPPEVDTASTIITISEINAPPIAVAQAFPAEVFIPHDGVNGVEPSSDDPFDYLPSFSVNGISSSDSDEAEDDPIVTYIWTLNEAILDSALSYTGTLPNVGLYDVVLTVFDAYDSSAVDTIIITVNEEPNEAPEVSFPNDTVFVQVASDGVPGGTQQVQLNDFQSSSDLDNDNFNKRWAIDINQNNIWDYGEPYTDENCNGIYDEGEPFDDIGCDGCEDDAAGDNQFSIYEEIYYNFQNLTADEPFDDANANGEYDNDEYFIDINLNNVWDDGYYYYLLTAIDPYCDSNSDVLTVIVNEENSPPILLDELNDTTLMENTFIELSSNPFDSDNPDSLDYIWTSNTDLIEFLNPTETNTGLTTPNLSTNEPVIIEVIFKVTDPFLVTASDTMYITVENNNVPPEIVEPMADLDVQEDAADTTMIITEIFNDFDLDTLSFSLENTNMDILQATLTDTSIIIDFLEDKFGNTDIILTADDGISRSSTSDTMSIIINPVNDAPIINSIAPDSAIEDVEYLYQINWEDIDDSIFVFTLADAPDGMVISDSGLVSWVPIDGVTSSDVVTIILEDNGGSEGVIKNDTEAFEVDITPINDAPEVISVAPDSAYEDIEYIYELEIYDPDDEEFTFQLFNEPDSMVVDENGIITWTPREGEVTSGIVTIQVLDGGEDGAGAGIQEFETFVNAINDPPIIISSIDTLTVFEDISQKIEVDNFEIVDPDNIYPDDFSVILMPGENYIADGDTLIPFTNYFGVLSVPMVISDGTDTSDEINLNVIVKSVNDPPLFTINYDTITVDEDFTVADTIIITALAQPDNESDQIIEYTLLPASIDFANVFLDQDLLSITYSSIQDSFGIQDIIIKATDDGGTDFSGLDTSITQFTFIVNSVNDLPSFELSQTDIQVDEDFIEAETIIIFNYEDIENDPPVFYINPDTIGWADITIDSLTGEITIIAVADSSGESDFIVTAIDDQESENGTDAYFSLLINPINDSPYFTFSVSDTLPLYEEFEDTIITIENFNEPDMDDVTFSITPNLLSWVDISIDSNTGDIILSSITDSSGQQIFTVSGDDGQGQDNSLFSRNFTLVVSNQNDPPLFELNMTEVLLQEDFSESDTIIITPLEIPPNEIWQEVTYSIIPDEVDFLDIVINSETGETYFQALPNKSGSQEFQIKAQDNGGIVDSDCDPGCDIDSALVTLNVVIEAVNDSIEIIQELNNMEIEEDSEHQIIDLEEHFIDVENSIIELDFSYSVDAYHIPDTNLITIIKNGLVLILSPNENANDTALVTITLSDLGDEIEETYGDSTISSNSASFTIIVNQVNDQNLVTDVSIHDAIPEDTTDYHFFISYENFDADSSLNSNPIAATVLSIDTTGIHFIDIELIDGLTQEWSLVNLLSNWNGIDSLAIITSVGLDIPDTTFWPIEVYAINDAPVIESVYFSSDLDTIPEDTTNVQYYVVYEDIDSDLSLNKEPFDLSLLNWEFDVPQTSSFQYFYSSYNNEVSEFWLDSLMSNWNGIDSLQIIVTDEGSLSDTIMFSIIVSQVIDPPEINQPVFEDGGTSIPEDTSDVNFIINYENIDANPALNYIPLGIDTMFVDLDHDIFLELIFVEENPEFGSLSQTWNIGSLSENWNGFDSLKVNLVDLEGGKDSIYFPIYIFQTNDLPDSFSVDSDFENYGIDLSTYYQLSNDFPDEDTTLIFRLPYQENEALVEQEPAQLLIKWNRTDDIDTDIELNNDLLCSLYYRIEFNDNINEFNYILGDSIPDYIYDNGTICDTLLQSVIESDTSFTCDSYSFLTDPMYAFYSINFTDSFPAYPDSIDYEDADLDNKLLLDINGGVKYTLQIIAQNFKPDSRNNDLKQLENAMNNPFYIDITLPEANFYLMQNEMFTEFFDLYIFPSDSIYDFPDLYQPMRIFLEPITPVSSYLPTYFSNGVYHVASNFDTTGLLTMEFQGRDKAQNYGLSIDSALYQIASPNSFNRFTSPSGISEITIPPGALTQETGIIIMEFDPTNLNRARKWQILPTISLSPELLEFDKPASIKFIINNSILELAEFWQIEINRETNDGWESIPTEYKDGYVISKINNFGDYSVFVNLDAEYEEVNILPENFALEAPYPNPFNGRTLINFDLPIDAHVEIIIYNIQGREVDQLASSWFSAGQHTLNWDANQFSSGLYFVTMNTNKFQKTNKVIFLK